MPFIDLYVISESSRCWQNGLWKGNQGSFYFSRKFYFHIENANYLVIELIGVAFLIRKYRSMRFLYCQSRWERRGRNSRAMIASTRLYAPRKAHRACTVLRRGFPSRRSGNWENEKLSEDTQTRAFSLRFRARGIEGARLSKRREKQHLHKKCEIVTRANLRRSSIATSDSQVTLLMNWTSRNLRSNQ